MVYSLNFEDFLNLYNNLKKSLNNKSSCVVPICKTLLSDSLTPTLAYYKLRHKSKYSFLLESVEGGENLGRYSVLCTDIKYHVHTGDDHKTIITDTTNNHTSTIDKMPFDAIDDLLNSFVMSGVSEGYLSGGLVGYFNYDTIQHIEPYLKNIASRIDHCKSFPQASFLIPETSVVFDHAKQQLHIVNYQFLTLDASIETCYHSALNKIEIVEKALQVPITVPILSLPNLGSSKNVIFDSNFTKESWVDAVNKIKEYILAGDTFQAVLSQRFKTKLNDIDPFLLYRILRSINPSPYLYFLDFDEFQIIGSSPELLVKCDTKNNAYVRPIAGTRPRGKNEDEDKLYANELLNDPKELAEHIMLVDLGRNDLGKVCEYNSIKLSQYMVIENYSHVMHIVSEIVGKLRANVSIIDLLKATFPAGTVSGAPKVRSMEIIYELEKAERGPYAGCVGFIGFDKTINTAIGIRTMLFKDNYIYIQVGAGIVADSDPYKEYDETVNKAKALLETIRCLA